MKATCKSCGKPLRDPLSIARGMGPKCAGISSAGRSFRARGRIDSRAGSPLLAESLATTNIFSLIEGCEARLPDTLRRFPSDLVDLVLSAPPPGAIAARVRWYSRRKHKHGLHPARILKQIRRMCIELRLLFWPGLSKNLEPIPCIPHGEDDWKMGENGRVMSRDELVAYLSQYGMIAQEQVSISPQLPQQI